MQPGERVRLAGRVYRNFRNPHDWSWKFIDYVLDEFGAEYTAETDEMQRVLECIRSLSDDNLLALHAHLHPDAAHPPAPLPQIEAPGPWQPGWFRLFVSQTAVHKALQGVKSWMERVHVDGFVAHSTIEPTREWEDEIRAALKTCDAFGALLTEDFPKSRWCDQEVGVAVGLRKLIVPVRLDIDPYGFIGRYQGLTIARSSPATEAWNLGGELFGLLARHEMTKERMTEPILRRFIYSWSWDNTRATWPFFIQLPKDVWTKERVATTREAAKINTELRDGVLADGHGTPVPRALESHLRSLGVWPEDEPPASPFAAGEIPSSARRAGD
jgi:hypothetical protein